MIDTDKELQINLEEGKKYLDTGEIDKALIAYKQAINNKSNDILANSYVGYVYFIKKQYSKSKIYLNNALNFISEINYSNYNEDRKRNVQHTIKIIKSDTYVFLGIIEISSNPIKALEYFNQAIEINAEHTSAYDNRGHLYLDLDQCEEAINDFDKAINLDPNFVASYYRRAAAYRRTEQVQRAFQDYVIVEELCRGSQQLDEYKRGLWEFFAREDYNAPLLVYRIINQIFSFTIFSQHSAFITQNLKECGNIVDLLEFVDKSNMFEKSKFELLKGVITFYMIDPSVCFKIFEENIRESRDNLLISHYYLILASYDYLKSDYNAIVKNALLKAEEYLSNKFNDRDILQSYYAGQIFFINGSFEKALNCFLKCDDFIPAICMKAICASELNLENLKIKTIEELLILHKNNTNLFQYINIPNISIDDFETTIMNYAHCKEIEGIVDLLNDFLESSSHSWNNITFPTISKLLKIDSNTENGKATLQKVKMWKKDVLDDFCHHQEHLLMGNIRDHFIMWNNEVNTDKVEESIGAEIPLLKDKKIDVVGLIDYFTVKEKLSGEARYLLIFWTQICEYRNKRLTNNQKYIIKQIVDLGFKYALVDCGIGIYTLGFIFSFVGIKYSAHEITQKLTEFIENIVFKDNQALPEFYSDFKDQFVRTLQNSCCP